ncbi:VWA domain-containing protein [Arcicella sp. LKC2W]|uniref:vWA domain-containing protein n=1 Tax=Arcicella sp. LKC2W TaxID=2984198 RepID=UPI002B20D957|nr:VWA domain-containing protein [Arcicella sp. LKC2W]MEA5457514.1 VWA domain-containing protein [Arcicella sp. LKC2W]
MNFTSEFSNTEQWFLAVFLILYLIFLGRIFWIARRLGTSAGSSVLKFLLRGVYFSLMLLALLNPSFGELKGTVKAQGKDILLLIDISKSMDATDIQPSRIEKAKFELNRFINHFSKDRIGLIVFSEDALLLSPLTFDNNAINYLVPKINTDLLPEGGTNFTPALELALDRFSKAKAKTQSKVIVLISDGENFGAENKALKAKIRQKEINFFSVGVGTTDGITIRDGKSFKKDKDGNIVVTKLETATLKKLAAETKGNYLEIKSVSESINELIMRVENIETDLVDERQIDVIANKYFYFLIIALFLLGIDVFFTVRTFQL